MVEFGFLTTEWSEEFNRRALGQMESGSSVGLDEKEMDELVSRGEGVRVGVRLKDVADGRALWCLFLCPGCVQVVRGGECEAEVWAHGRLKDLQEWSGSGLRDLVMLRWKIVGQLEFSEGLDVLRGWISRNYEALMRSEARIPRWESFTEEVGG